MSITMPLKKKIALIFLISVSIIAILSVFEFINFIEVKREVRYLEVADTIRSRSLQIRRHEKNFFLYPLQAKMESESIKKYIGELHDIVNENDALEKSGELKSIEGLVNDYGARLESIKRLLRTVLKEFEQARKSHPDLLNFFPLIESSFYEQPLISAQLLEKAFSLPRRHPLITNLGRLDAEIVQLRKTGEDLVSASREIDKVARGNVDSLVRTSQVELIIFLMLFFIGGIVALFLINRNVVSRLKLLINIVERTGAGNFPRIELPMGKWDNDEVGKLIREFNGMEGKLALRQEELNRKSTELLQSKKLAAIGTLAAGVAHELNNPLNNIYLSVQVLKRELGTHSSLSVQEIVEDITSQTTRVKHIVGDLLEFARGKAPEFRTIDLKGLVAKAYKAVSNSMNVEGVRFVLESDQEDVVAEADPDQLEQVFINLFHNAVEAMAGTGELKAQIESHEEFITIQVIDTGKGMPPAALEKIFEPFFTTKDKGTGLGLAIVFNIILKHNGDIRAESEVGKGTRFSITLPKEREGHGI
jgi:two-component system NtrC family sensor kinase